MTQRSRVDGILLDPVRATTKTVREEPVIAAVLAGGLGGIMLLSAATGNDRWRAYLLLFSVMLPLFCWVHQYVRFERSHLWLMVGLSILHAAGGLVEPPDSDAPVLYQVWLIEDTLKFDQLVHGIGGGVVTWLGWHLADRVARPDANVAVLAGIAMMVGNGFGALNEVAEFFVDGELQESFVGGYENVGWDLVFNLAGSLVIGAVGAAIVIRRRRAQEPDRVAD